MKILKKILNVLDVVTDWSLIVGGLNWGLIQFLGFNLASWLGELVKVRAIPGFIYGLVGVSAVYQIVRYFQCK